MCINLNVPSVDYNTYFGSIKKVVWFEVTEEYEYFDVTLSINRSQLFDTNITINNLGSTGGNQWQEIFPKTSDTTPVVRNLKLLNVPGLATQIYGVFNLPQ